MKKTRAAIKRFERSGGLSRNQLLKAAAEPWRYARFRGDAIDRYVKRALEGNGRYRLAGPFEKRPDIVDRTTGYWCDVTTRKQGDRHVPRYEQDFGSKGVGIIYEYE